MKGNDSWSKSELVQAICVMATFHSLCSFVLGCGVVPEIDLRGGARLAGEPVVPVSPPIDSDFGIMQNQDDNAANVEEVDDMLNLSTSTKNKADDLSDTITVSHTMELIQRLMERASTENSPRLDDFLTCITLESTFLRIDFLFSL